MNTNRAANIIRLIVRTDRKELSHTPIPFIRKDEEDEHFLGVTGIYLIGVGADDIFTLGFAPNGGPILSTLSITSDWSPYYEC